MWVWNFFRIMPFLFSWIIPLTLRKQTYLFFKLNKNYLTLPSMLSPWIWTNWNGGNHLWREIGGGACHPLAPPLLQWLIEQDVLWSKVLWLFSIFLMTGALDWWKNATTKWPPESLPPISQWWIKKKKWIGSYMLSELKTLWILWLFKLSNSIAALANFPCSTTVNFMFCFVQRIQWVKRP